MNKIEVAKVLTIASGFDRRQIDEMQVEAWHAAIGQYSFGAAQQAIIEHFKSPETRHDYLTVGSVLDRLESSGRVRVRDVEADVRSAKARGLIDLTWPRTQSLPSDVAARLAEAREKDRAEAIRLGQLEA